jgi:hypothetical protein
MNTSLLYQDFPNLVQFYQENLLSSTEQSLWLDISIFQTILSWTSSITQTGDTRWSSGFRQKTMHRLFEWLSSEKSETDLVTITFEWTINSRVKLLGLCVSKELTSLIFSARSWIISLAIKKLSQITFVLHLLAPTHTYSHLSNSSGLFNWARRQLLSLFCPKNREK